MSAGRQATAHRLPNASVPGSRRKVLRRALPLLLFTVLWLLATIPAQWALAAFGSNLAATGVSGSVWNGSAGNLLLRAGAGWLALGDSHWRLLPLDSLRAAALCMRIESRLAEQALQGRVCIRSDQRLQAQDLELALPAAATQVPGGLQLAGNMLLLVETLELDGERVRKLVARGSWEGAAVHDGRRWIELGTLGVQTTDETTLSDLHAGLPEWHVFDVAGPLQLDLRAGMDSSGRLRLGGEAVPLESASPALRAILDFVATERSGERYHLVL